MGKKWYKWACNEIEKGNDIPSIKSSSSKYKGVNLLKDGRWVARVTINGERKYLGRFLTEEGAYSAIKREVKGLKIDGENITSE